MPPSFDLVVYHHLGLGDHLVCNALVRHHAARRQRVGLLCKFQYQISVAFMYRDLPQIEILPVADDQEARMMLETMPNTPLLKVGFERLDSRNFVESFYRQVGVSVEKRHTGFHVERDHDREEACYRRLTDGKAPYIFLHDDASRGFTIDPRRIHSSLPEIRPTGSDNIFDYMAVIERADEIHCIDSAFANLVESLPRLSAKRLVLHTYAKPTSHVVYGRHAWEKPGLMPPGLPRAADVVYAYWQIRYLWTCWRTGWR
jgi:hypothetical protein